MVLQTNSRPLPRTGGGGRCEEMVFHPTTGDAMIDEKSMTLAQDDCGQVSIDCWLASEKPNGCRAHFDGKQLRTRPGNQIRFLLVFNVVYQEAMASLILGVLGTIGALLFDGAIELFKMITS